MVKRPEDGEGVAMRENEKTCMNCLFEYPCSWEPAGEESCCPEWRPEGRTDEEDKNISVSAC